MKSVKLLSIGEMTEECSGVMEHLNWTPRYKFELYKYTNSIGYIVDSFKREKKKRLSALHPSPTLGPQIHNINFNKIQYFNRDNILNLSTCSGFISSLGLKITSFYGTKAGPTYFTS